MGARIVQMTCAGYAVAYLCIRAREADCEDEACSRRDEARCEGTTRSHDSTRLRVVGDRVCPMTRPAAFTIRNHNCVYLFQKTTCQPEGYHKSCIYTVLAWCWLLPPVHGLYLLGQDPGPKSTDM
jgi:hypothetical protein